MKETFSLAPPRLPSFLPVAEPVHTLIPRDGALPPPPTMSVPPSRRSFMPPGLPTLASLGALLGRGGSVAPPASAPATLPSNDIEALYKSISVPRSSKAPPSGLNSLPPPSQRLTIPAGSSSTYPKRDSVAPPTTRLSQIPSRISQIPSRIKSIAPTALVIAAGALTQACAASEPPPPAQMGTALSMQQLEVTEGSLHQAGPGTFAVDDAKMRAVSAVEAGDSADLKFTYEGTTKDAVALDSGEMRRQLGIKLRAQDGCNVVYVMWHIDPTPELMVQVKTNPGQSTYDECHDNGYKTITPDYKMDMPKLDVGGAHTLSASIENGRLLVRADGKAVWEGELPASSLEMHGPMGVRSDNAKFQFSLVPGNTATPDAWAQAVKGDTTQH